jgi:hypothetical protein
MDTQWMGALADDEKLLVELSHKLYIREQSWAGASLPDYSFIVFPIAKAYEGFLKRLLYEWGLVDVHEYEGKKFRIGRALNPDVRLDQRDEYWLFDDLAKKCGQEMARQLWEVWLSCRNQVFHFFPQNPNFVTLKTAGTCLKKIDQAMEMALRCL